MAQCIPSRALMLHVVMKSTIHVKRQLHELWLKLCMFVMYDTVSFY